MRLSRAPVRADSFTQITPGSGAFVIGRMEEENNTEYAINHLKSGKITPKTCTEPQMSGPITQTSPGTERGGRYDDIRNRRSPTRKLGKYQNSRENKP